MFNIFSYQEMQVKPHYGHTGHNAKDRPYQELLRMEAIIIHILMSGVYHSSTTLKNCLAILCKARYNVIWPSKRNENIGPQKDLQFKVMEVLFIIAKTQKQFKYPENKMIKLWCSHSLQYYYLAIKRNKLLIHIFTWLNLINIRLSERSQMPKSAYYMIPLI